MRIKSEMEYTQAPVSIVNPATPSPAAISLIDANRDSSLAGGLASSIAPADMLNVWNATKLSSKAGMNTADGIT